MLDKIPAGKDCEAYAPIYGHITGLYAHIPRARDYIQAIEKEKIKFIEKMFKKVLDRMDIK